MYIDRLSQIDKLDLSDCPTLDYSFAKFLACRSYFVTTTCLVLGSCHAYQLFDLTEAIQLWNITKGQSGFDVSMHGAGTTNQQKHVIIFNAQWDIQLYPVVTNFALDDNWKPEIYAAPGGFTVQARDVVAHNGVLKALSSWCYGVDQDEGIVRVLPRRVAIDYNLRVDKSSTVALYNFQAGRITKFE